MYISERILKKSDFFSGFGQVVCPKDGEMEDAI